MRIISPGSRRTSRERSIPSGRQIIILAFMHSNDDHLRSVLEMSIYLDCGILRWVGARERKLSTITCFFLFRFLPRVDRAMTDDRNNWIAGCLKHAHFKRTAEWILERWASRGSWEIRFGSTLRNSALEYKCVFGYVKRILDDAFNNIPRRKGQLFLRSRNYSDKERRNYSGCFCEEVSCKKSNS